MTESPDARNQQTVTVDEHDTLPQVLDRIRAAGGDSLTLEIPEHCPILLTATEFRTLRDVADRHRLTLSLKTDDPLRLQLGSMFGLAAWDRPGHVADASLDGEIESTPAFRGWRSARAKHAARMGGDAPPAEDPIAVSRRRRTELYEPGATSERARLDEPNVGLSDDATHVALSYLDQDPGAARARLVGRLVAVALVVALIAGLAGWYFMPGVTVRATLRQGQIGTELLYSVTRPGASAPADAAFAVEAVEATDTVEFDVTVPASGVEVTPDQAASGTVTLRNASPEAVTVPAGTTLATVTGIAFVTTGDVEVPPGSPDGSTIGEATVEVEASAPGTASNLAAGEFSGKVPDLPVYFANRGGAMSGGTDIEVAVVTDEDIAALEAQVENDLRRVVAEDWSARLPEGQAILTPSVEVEDPEYTIDGAAGDEAESVTLRGTVQATGLQYDRASVEDQALSHYEDALAALVPEGYELVPDSVVLGEPSLVAESPDSVEYEMGATAVVRARVDDGTRDALAEDLAGADWERAGSILANVPAFETWSMETSPGWWPDRLPRAASRITVEIEEALPITATAPDATPVATAEGEPS
jgi:hypothetical protein